MDLTFYVLFLVSAAIGTGSSFIADVFFIFSYKNHVLRVNELKMLSRLQLIGIVSAAIAFAARVLYDAFLINQHAEIQIGVETAIMGILSIILVSSIILRRFHLPALLRHQQRYSHLSDTFKDHHDALISTCALTLISWLCLIVIASFEARSLLYSLNFVNIFFPYCLVAFLGIQSAQQIKGFYKQI